jgi:hypothetical protein
VRAPKLRLALALICLLLVLAAPTPAAAACRFAAASGEGLTMWIGLRGDPGVGLRVDWGDGTVTQTQVARAGGNRALLRHAYQGPGKYTMRLATVGDPLNCVVEQTVELPYDGGDEPDAIDIVPPERRGGPDDAEIGSERSPLERLLDALGGLFGR